MPYPWYESSNGLPLEQGDFLKDCLLPVLPRTDPDEAAKPQQGGIYDRVIVLSQSCDLADRQIRNVMVSPAYLLSDFLSKNCTTREQQRNMKANLKRGRLTAYHLLNICELENFELPHLVVDFGDAFSVPIEYAEALAGTGNRLRLLPPYREQMAQMFARFYMRVGLPIDVAEFP